MRALLRQHWRHFFIFKCPIYATELISCKSIFFLITFSLLLAPISNYEYFIRFIFALIYNLILPKVEESEQERGKNSILLFRDVLYFVFYEKSTLVLVRVLSERIKPTFVSQELLFFFCFI